MAVIISLLRGVNVGGHNLVKMEALRALYATLGLQNAETYVQSGSVVFRTAERDSARLARRIEDAIERTVGIRPDVLLRTAAELRDVVSRNPFAARLDVESKSVEPNSVEPNKVKPNKLVVTFLASEPAAQARAKLLALPAAPEELRLDGRELFTYYPNGIGQSKLSMAAMDRALGIRGTARNWNTVTRLLVMAQKLEGAI